MTVLECLPEGARVAIIRLRSLGDCVLTTPAIAILKGARPDLQLGVVAEPPFQSVFEGNPLVHQILAPSWRSVRKFGSTLCVNLHGGSRSQWMTMFSGARWRAGFAHYRTTFAYNIRIPRAQRTLGVNRTVHTVEHLASAFFAMGAPLTEIPRAQLFTDPAPASELSGRYAVLHPFASTPEKTWPAERFCEVARYLRLWNIQPVFIAGRSDDVAPFAAHTVLQGSLAQLKSVFSGAAVFVGGDSGPAHMAAAFGVPSVVIFSSTNPSIWGPWRTEAEVVVANGGIQGVTVSRIIAALERLKTLEEGARLKDFSRLFKYALPYLPALIASIVLMAIVGLSQGLLVKLIPFIFERVLDPNSPEGPAELFHVPNTDFSLYLNDFFPGSFHNIWSMVAFGILGCFLAKGVCDYAGNYLINWVGISAIMDLRQDVFDRVLHQDAKFFEDKPTARIMSSIMSDIDRIQVSISTMLADWLRQMFTAIFLLLALVTTDWRLSLVSLLVFPVVALLTTRLGKRIRSSTRHAQDMAAGLNEILQETLTGHQVVKSFGAEDFEAKRFRLASQRLKSGSLRYVAQQALASPIIELFGAMTIIGLLWLGRQQVKHEVMTAGKFTAFIMALVFLYEPIKRLTNIHNIFQQGIGAALRVFSYMDGHPDVVDKPNAVALGKFGKQIRFSNVGFHYPNATERPVLQDINLDVKAGDVVALVGPSGAGKTTLANLVPRFYDAVSGAVLIDGKDVRDIRLNSLRENISIVAQDTFLFNSSVFDNIAYGRPDARPDEVLAAAKAALADEFVERLPDKYATVIGERGLRLSGGQRQRLAIARALLKNAPILILDEATSHLDTESERLVQQALTVLMKRRTVLVIAHRLSTIRQATKIVVLEAGRIVETGTHDELMGKSGVYHRLHELQHADANAIAG